LSDTQASNKKYVDQQDTLNLALTGGTMSGVVDMGSNKITNLGNPANGNDATNKNYVVNNFVQLSGSIMTGNLNMNSNKITNLATPTNNNDAVNKNYVDNNFLPLSGGTISSNLLCQNYVTIGNAGDLTGPASSTPTYIRPCGYFTSNTRIGAGYASGGTQAFYDYVIGVSVFSS
jgi:hypothetical protein